MYYDSMYLSTLFRGDYKWHALEYIFRTLNGRGTL
jgi:hypothetical protein